MMLPESGKPQQSKNKTIAIALKMANKLGVTLDITKPFVLGQRGYFRDSMGVVGRNDRGEYDDAIFIVSPELYLSFNGNTDPSRYRDGHGEGSSKGMASLAPGIWTYKRGLHRGQYMALVQRVEAFDVIRDAKGDDYHDLGWHGINIHRGGKTTTSSLGCQTLPPNQ